MMMLPPSKIFRIWLDLVLKTSHISAGLHAQHKH